MTSPKERIASEIDQLLKDGDTILVALSKKDAQTFFQNYQQWYTRALSVVRVLMPDREIDFRRLYERDGKRKLLAVDTYVLEDYAHGFGIGSFDIHEVALARFHNQLSMLKSANFRLIDTLANIRGLLQADLFDSELDAARELLRNGHIRAAGALAGVTLEAHLAQVCMNHSIAVAKKNPDISSFNEALKQADIIDIPQWRWVQRLADIRNLCVHKKGREPTPDEVDELISGVDKAIKTLA